MANDQHRVRHLMIINQLQATANGRKILISIFEADVQLQLKRHIKVKKKPLASLLTALLTEFIMSKTKQFNVMVY